MLQLSLLEESLWRFLIDNWQWVELLEQSLSNFIVLVFKELLEGPIVTKDKFLCLSHIDSHHSVDENGALLKMGISAVLHDLLEEALEEIAGLRSSPEEKFSCANE